MKKVFNIIGTDTEIGKTHACCEILDYLNTHTQITAVALKPIASGVEDSEYGFINSDVLRLFKANQKKLSFAQICPISLNQAIAPHIAAQIDNVELSIDKISNTTKQIIKQCPAEVVLIEGVGGIMVPLNFTETYLDLLDKFNYPVILVVGMKLGCLNHALLTIHALNSRNIPLAGWIANCITPNMPSLEDNIVYLSQKLPTPLIGIITHQKSIELNNNFSQLFLQNL